MKGALLIGPNPTAQLRWARANADRLAAHLLQQRREATMIYAIAAGRATPAVREWIANQQLGVAPVRTVYDGSWAQLRGTFERGYDWRPGELSLAHGGVLLLQGVTEFSAAASGEIGTAYLRKVVSFRYRGEEFGSDPLGIDAPADFVIIATASGCPCGHRPSCTCTIDECDRHLARIPQWLRDACDVVGPEEYSR